MPRTIAALGAAALGTASLGTASLGATTLEATLAKKKDRQVQITVQTGATSGGS